MLAQEFIYGFWDNNEQGPTMTETSSQATFSKKTFSSNIKQSNVFSVNNSFKNKPIPNWEIYMDWENDI